jgi:phage I-like protein
MNACQELATLSDGRKLIRVACELDLVESEGAHWCQILPFGPFVAARDGRSFIVSSIEKVLLSTKTPLLFDWEHQSESFFGSTRASGWGEELFVEDGIKKRFPRPGIWARAEWTEEGAKDVKSKAFRYLSPVVLLDPESREAQEIASVALTNRPALEMQGLESYRERLSARYGQFQQGEQSMKPENLVLLLSALGLQAGAAEVDIISAARSAFSSKELLAAANAELTTLRARVTDLEKTQKEAERSSFESEVKTTIEAGAREGRITPAAAPKYLAFCLKSRENFNEFKENILTALPVLGEPAPRTDPKVENPGTKSSDEEQKQNESLARMGFSAEEIANSRKHIAEVRAKREG